MNSRKSIIITILLFLLINLLPVTVNADTAQDWDNKGYTLYSQGKYEEAIKCFDKALEINPQDAYAWCNKGNSLYSQGKYEEAIKCFDKALEINPKFESAKDTKKMTMKQLSSNASIPDIPSVEQIPSGMVFIKGGKFKMGSQDAYDSAYPVHEVEVGSFYMGKYEVTNKEYAEYDSKYVSCGDNYPVEVVAWKTAVNYCNWLSKKEGLTPCYTGEGEYIKVDISKNGYRLPTEAEWEYACRTGTKTKYYWGDIMDKSYCWYKGNSLGRLHEVGQKKSNNWGLYDMSGNVWEWCNDWHKDYTPGYVKDSTGPASGIRKVIRGGGYLNDENACSSAYHTYFDFVEFGEFVIKESSGSINLSLSGGKKKSQENISSSCNSIGFRLVRTYIH